MLDKDQFKIGSFVTVDYVQNRFFYSVNTVVLSVMTLITKVDIPQF